MQFEGAIASGTSSVAFMLPSQFRPPKNAYVPIDLCNATKGRLFIQPSGVVTRGAGVFRCTAQVSVMV